MLCDKKATAPEPFEWVGYSNCPRDLRMFIGARGC
jgi:hypothetical protein